MHRKNTTELLQKLRSLMSNVDVVKTPISAYIIGSEDAHSSEYIAPCDNRRAFISGFDGSAGTAVVTHAHALLYTDGRYYLQASEQLDDNWTLMKIGLPETPSPAEWLAQNLQKGSVVGVDPFLFSGSDWDKMEKELSSSGKKIIAIKDNLVDLIWDGRPSRPMNPVVIHPLEFSGKPAFEKVKDARKEMADVKADMLVLTELDEIAWLLNLRGSDIKYNPVFFSYVIILPNKLYFFIDSIKLQNEVQSYLLQEIPELQILPYEDILNIFKDLIGQTDGRVWTNTKCNQALTALIPKDRIFRKLSPISLMKAVKNSVEIKGMKNCHIRDAVAQIDFIAWLEEALNKGETITEVSAADKLEYFRSKQKHFVGLSFSTISGSGPNGAIIHYDPSSAKESRKLSINEVYLVDSGGQYLDGTTDCTRTYHFSNPTEYQKECFTLVLKGQISLVTAVFPCKVTGKFLDSFARKHLWERGLDYMHGTSHGVGSYLNVHEGPCHVSFREYPEDEGLRPDMFISNEPGYYEQGKFGIRLENIIQCVPANTKYNFNQRGYLTFEDVTFVPIQRAMINVSMLTSSEIEYLNDFHNKCRSFVGDYMRQIGRSESDPGYKWLLKETEPLCSK